ncbi:hypothetical protein KJ996_02580, partial [Patescibacteria group bacterium]|nr:hypothetical protein [Patescibacteria group bacterium]
MNATSSRMPDAFAMKTERHIEDPSRTNMNSNNMFHEYTFDIASLFTYIDFIAFNLNRKMLSAKTERIIQITTLFKRKRGSSERVFQRIGNAAGHTAKPPANPNEVKSAPI